ncbi:MAG: hypothetical protein ABI317_05840 [Gaiellales bacterium]
MEIALCERFFLYVVPPAHWPPGHRPSILKARGPGGALIYREFLYPRQHCIYPGEDPVCRNLEMGTPTVTADRADAGARDLRLQLAYSAMTRLSPLAASRCSSAR